MKANAMKNQKSDAFRMNRRTVLRGAGGLMLGLPLLETFMPRRASAQAAARSPFVIIVVGDNGVVQAGVTLGGSAEPERFWPTATGTLTRDRLLGDKATRSIGELADHADKLLVVRGINLPYSSNGCSHSAADAQILTAAKITAGSTNCKAMGISVDTAIAKAKNPPGRDPLVLHAGMFSPGGTGFDIPGYVSYVTPQQPRVYIDSPYKAYQAITGVVGTGTTVTTAEAQAQMLRAARSKSINDLLRPQMQALLGRTDLSASDRARLDQHFTAIRDLEVKIAPTTVVAIPDADVATMRQNDPRPYDQATRDQNVKLFMQLMAFAVAADYSRVCVLKIGDRIDDHVYSLNGQTMKFHDASHRTSAASLDFHHAVDRLMMGFYKQLLDMLSSYTTPTGPLLDQGVAIWTNQCATGAHSFTNIPWIQAGTAQGFYKKGQYLTLGSGQQPGGSQDGKGGDASMGINKMLNTVLTAAGVTKTGGAPTDDFGEPTLPKGLFTELRAV
jgi:hypothetical protein